MTKSTLGTLAIAFLLPAGAPALAEELAADAASATVLEATAHAEVQVGNVAANEAGAELFGSHAVSETALHAIAGREDTSQVSQADLKAGVSNNSVGDNAVTGAAQIDGNAFQNMSGLSILNVNTGNNVAINAAMNVNISISPAP